jgi:DNA gyrase subunit A
MNAVNGDEDLMVITNRGIVLRTSLTQIRETSRATQGVKIIRLEDDGKTKVSSIAIVAPSEEVEVVEEVTPEIA